MPARFLFGSVLDIVGLLQSLEQIDLIQLATSSSILLDKIAFDFEQISRLTGGDPWFWNFVKIPKPLLSPCELAPGLFFDVCTW